MTGTIVSTALRDRFDNVIFCAKGDLMRPSVTPAKLEFSFTALLISRDDVVISLVERCFVNSNSRVFLSTSDAQCSALHDNNIVWDVMLLDGAMLNDDDACCWISKLGLKQEMKTIVLLDESNIDSVDCSFADNFLMKNTIPIALMAMIDKVVRQKGDSTVGVGGSKSDYEGENASIKLFYELFNSAPDALAVTDTNGIIRVANPRFFEWFGGALSDVVGKPAEAFLGTFERSRHEQLRTEYLRSPTQKQFQVTRECADGVTRHFHSIIMPKTLNGQSSVVIAFRDISTQVSLVQSLVDQDKRVSALFESAPLGIAELAAESLKFLSVNEKVCELTGYTREALLSGITLSSLCSSEHETNFAEGLVFDHAKPMSIEKLCRRADGSTIWLSLHLMMFAQVTSVRPNCVTLMMYDITDKKLSALEEEKRRGLLQTVTDYCPSVLTLRDSSGRFIFVNKAATELYKIPSHDLVGKTTTDLSHLPWVGAWDRLNQVVFDPPNDSLVQDMQDLVVEQQGVKKVFRGSAVRVLIDEQPHILVTKTDVTELVDTAQALHDANSHLQAMLDAFPDVIFRIDADCNIIDLRVGVHTSERNTTGPMLGKHLRDILTQKTGLIK